MEIKVCLDISEVAGGEILFSGTRFSIVDKYKFENRSYLALTHAQTGDKFLKTVDGVLKLDDSIILLLGSADPSDCETEFRSFLVVRYCPENTLEIVEKEFLPRIQDASEDAIKAVERTENLVRVESVLGALRGLDD